MSKCGAFEWLDRYITPLNTYLPPYLPIPHFYTATVSPRTQLVPHHDRNITQCTVLKPLHLTGKEDVEDGQRCNSGVEDSGWGQRVNLQQGQGAQK